MRGSYLTRGWEILIKLAHLALIKKASVFYAQKSSKGQFLNYSNVNLKVSVLENTVFYIRYKICPLIKLTSKYKCNAMVSFEPSPQNMNEMQWDLFKQPPKSKTRDKYCHVFFMARNEIGLLTSFARINKRGGLNKIRGVGEKNGKLIKDSLVYKVILLPAYRTTISGQKCNRAGGSRQVYIWAIYCIFTKHLLHVEDYTHLLYVYV